MDVVDVWPPGIDSMLYCNRIASYEERSCHSNLRRVVLARIRWWSLTKPCYCTFRVVGDFVGTFSWSSSNLVELERDTRENWFGYILLWCELEQGLFACFQFLRYNCSYLGNWGKKVKIFIFQVVLRRHTLLGEGCYFWASHSFLSWQKILLSRKKIQFLFNWQNCMYGCMKLVDYYAPEVQRSNISSQK